MGKPQYISPFGTSQVILLMPACLRALPCSRLIRHLHSWAVKQTYLIKWPPRICCVKVKIQMINIYLHLPDCTWYVFMTQEYLNKLLTDCIYVSISLGSSLVTFISLQADTQIRPAMRKWRWDSSTITSVCLLPEKRERTLCGFMGMFTRTLLLPEAITALTARAVKRRKMTSQLISFP